MFIIEISYNVLYVWHCMELYDKKFLIYGNCMIRNFGHPGKLICHNLFVIRSENYPFVLYMAYGGMIFI